MNTNGDSRMHTDVIVVGGGPAGLTCATESANNLGAKTLLVERAKYFGGTPQSTHHLGFGMRDLHRFTDGPSYAKILELRAQDAGVILRNETTLNGWSSDFVVDLLGNDDRYQADTRAIVLATGVRERTRHARLVPGDRGFGVFTTGALQRLVYQLGAKVGNKAVIVGAEHVSFTAISTLSHGGCKTVALITTETRDQTFVPIRWFFAGRRRVPIITKDGIATIHGTKRVTGVTLNSGRHIECDTVVFTGDWVVENDLARQHGIEICPGSKAPRVDSFGRTRTPGVFAVGNGVHPAEAADVCALNAKRTTVGLREWFDGGQWQQNSVAVTCDPKILWTWPSLVSDDDVDCKMLLRVAKFVEGPTRISVRQADQELWSANRRSTIVTNRSISVPMPWAANIDPCAGDVDIVLER